MRLSDAGLHCHQTKLIYPDHRLPPWLTEVAPRNRSNRLLDPGHTKNEATLLHQSSRFRVVEKDYGKQNEAGNNNWNDGECVFNWEARNHEPQSHGQSAKETSGGSTAISHSLR